MKFSRKTENLIANFRSLPEDRSKSLERTAYPINSLVEVIIEKYRIGQTRREDIILKHWKSIMGIDLAQKCRPLKITKDNIVIISVSSTIIRQELTFHKYRIVERIRKLHGCQVIKNVAFKIG